MAGEGVFPRLGGKGSALPGLRPCDPSRDKPPLLLYSSQALKSCPSLFGLQVLTPDLTAFGEKYLAFLSERPSLVSSLHVLQPGLIKMASPSWTSKARVVKFGWGGKGRWTGTSSFWRLVISQGLPPLPG